MQYYEHCQDDERVSHLTDISHKEMSVCGHFAAHLKILSSGNHHTLNPSERYFPKKCLFVVILQHT
jgi:hypothetical protein